MYHKLIPRIEALQMYYEACGALERHSIDKSTCNVQAEIQRIEGYVDSMHHTDDAHDVCQDQTRLG